MPGFLLPFSPVIEHSFVLNFLPGPFTDLLRKLLRPPGIRVIGIRIYRQTKRAEQIPYEEVYG